MKHVLMTLGLAVAMSSAAAAQQTNVPWIGVWQGTLDGQPGVTVTIADDAGPLGGTIALDIVARNKGDAAHVLAVDPHMILSPRTNGTTLTFRVRMLKGEQREFTMTRIGDNNAHLKCTNCGGSPEVEVVRARLHPKQ